MLLIFKYLGRSKCLLATFPDSQTNGHGQRSMAASDVVRLVQRSLQPEMSRRMEARQRMDDAAVRSALANGNSDDGNGVEKASDGDRDQR